MDDEELRLDGNAAAGVLSEVFVNEMTASHVMCDSCGEARMMGEERLYMYPLSPGAVVRCVNCDEPLLVLVHRRGALRVGIPGIRWLEFPEPG